MRKLKKRNEKEKLKNNLSKKKALSKQEAL